MIIDPNAMNQIKRIWIIMIKLIKRLIEIILQNGIYPDRIGSHFLDRLEPSEVSFYINGILSGIMTGNADAHIHTTYKKLLISFPAVEINFFTIGRSEGGYRSRGIEINKKTGLIDQIVCSDDKNNQPYCSFDKPFHRIHLPLFQSLWPASLLMINFLLADS